MIKILSLFILLALFGCGNDNEPSGNEPEEENRIDWYAAANSSSSTLANLFWNGGGKYFNYDSNGNEDFHYWPQAHALDVLIDAYQRTGKTKYKNYFGQWFEGVK